MTIQVLGQPTTIPKTEDDLFYPDSDGQPMGETGIHVRAMLYVYYALRTLLGTRTDIYIAANMFLYYEKGNPRAYKAPDVMVVQGVRGNHERRSFKVWEEGVAPAVIFEMTSRATWIEDLVNKSRLYAHLGVQEYFIFDPLEEYLEESLQGLQLVDQDYAPIPVNEDGSLTSRILGVRIRREGDLLRVLDPKTNEPVPWESETVALIEHANQRATEADRRAREAEAENARLRAQLAQVQGKQDS